MIPGHCPREWVWDAWNSDDRVPLFAFDPDELAEGGPFWPPAPIPATTKVITRTEDGLPVRKGAET